MWILSVICWSNLALGLCAELAGFVSQLPIWTDSISTFPACWEEVIMTSSVLSSISCNLLSRIHLLISATHASNLWFGSCGNVVYWLFWLSHSQDFGINCLHDHSLKTLFIAPIVDIIISNDRIHISIMGWIQRIASLVHMFNCVWHPNNITKWVCPALLHHSSTGWQISLKTMCFVYVVPF